MEVYSNSARTAILETLSTDLFLLAHRALLVEPDPHLATALGQFALLLKRESFGIPTNDESWLRGDFTMLEWLERTRV